jgi:hypothetical protein
MKRFAFFITLFAFFIALLTSGSVYAANLDYLSYEKWDNNRKVKSVDIYKTSRENHLNGKLKYVVDNDNLIVYSNISFDESTLSGEDDDIRVIYEFVMHDETYSFALDSEGICEDSGDAEQTFEVGQNFFYNGETPQCLSYAQYLGDSSGGRVRIYLFVNNSRYLVFDSIRIEKPTTTKKQTTTKKKVEKKKTTKAKAKTKIVYRKATTVKKASTTKKKSSTSRKYAGNVTVDNTAQSGMLSGENRYLIIFAAVVGAVAAMYIAYSIGKAKSDDNSEINNDE